MPYNEKMFNRQLGRNTQLFAQAVGALETPEARYPYLRILVSVIEQVRPEWIQVPQKEQLFTHLINEMTESQVAGDEIARVIQVRDRERQFLHDIAAGKVKPKPKAEAVPAPEAPAREAPAREEATHEAPAQPAVAPEASGSASPEPDATA